MLTWHNFDEQKYIKIYKSQSQSVSTTHIGHMPPAGGLEAVLDVGIVGIGVNRCAYAVPEHNVHQLQRRLCCVWPRSEALVQSVGPHPGRQLRLRPAVEHDDGNDRQDSASGQGTHREYLFTRAVTEYHPDGVGSYVPYTHTLTEAEVCQ